MKRVAALYLPDWPIERLRQAERTAHRQPPEAAPAAPFDAALGTLGDAAAKEQEHACSVPRGGGWRPGARWAREERERQIAALPAHQRPSQRQLGRCDEAAGNPFRPMRSDEVRSQIPAGKPPAQLLPQLPEGAEPSRSDGGGAVAQTVGDSSTKHRRLQHRLTQHAAHGPAGAARRLRLPRSGEEPAPLVTALRTGNRQVIAAACPVARALGIRPGMAVTEARAYVTALDIRPADAEGDRAALHWLALRAARRWAPSVSVEGTDTLLIDLTGVAHLHGGEEAMARRMVRLLARRGHHARIAIADTPGAAWALAHFGSYRHPGVLDCPPGEHPVLLAPLPISALRTDPTAIEMLKRLGIEQIGQLVAMPRAPLARRFGAALVTRLEQALGTLPEPLDPVVPREAVAVTRRFAEPVATAEAIAHWIGALVPELCAVLAQKGLGARAIELIADRVDGVPQRIRVGLARASRDTLHIVRLIARRIEDVEPGYGIDAIALHVRRAEPLAARPIDERLDEEVKPDLAPLADLLATRIGSRRMWRSRPVESDVPERSVGRDAVLDPPARARVRMKPGDVRQLDHSAAPDPWRPDWPRPARLLHRPERLDHVLAELPDQPPRRFTWRGRTIRVVRADGPERIAGEWWRRTAEAHAVRDYFRVEDEGGHRYWLFRRGDGERSATGDLSWYLHGLFG